jgi:hypothetical protein
MITKLLIAFVLLSSIAGAGWYVKTLIKDNQQLSSDLKLSKDTIKSMEDSFIEQKKSLIILDNKLKQARKRKVKVIERVITLDNRKESFIKKQDKELPKDLEIEFNAGLKALSCATGEITNCKKGK